MIGGRLQIRKTQMLYKRGHKILRALSEELKIYTHSIILLRQRSEPH
jgi:hypothetical protein